MASEHKRPEGLHKESFQWAKPPDVPAPLEQYLPTRWQQPGFVRTARLNSVAFFDFFVKHNVQTDAQLWPTAPILSAARRRKRLGGGG